MTEFLSMTMLSTEPVSAAKPLAVPAADSASEPDQSFAATLAAEVNGKAGEKAGKHSAKTRQNTASEQAGSKKDKAAEAQSSARDVKNDKPQTSSETAVAQAEDAGTEPVEQELEQLQNEKGDADQAHWLQLLDKAKTLQERLSQTETEKAAVLADPESKAEPLPSDELAQIAATAKQQTDKTKAVEGAVTDQVAAAKAKVTTQSDAAISLDEKLLTEQNSEQHLTEDELAALKLVSQSDKTLADKAIADKAATGKNPPTEAVLKQNLVEQKMQQSEQGAATAADKQTTKPDVVVKKDTGPDQVKNQLAIEKPLKTLDAAQGEKQAEPAAEAGVATGSKTPLQTEQVNSALKAVSVVAVTSEQDTEQQTATDTENSAPSSTEPKASVQAQSAAALVAAPASQAKAAVAEPKVTTEEALKQIQSATTAMQGEQGASSSSGESSSHNSAEAVLSVIEQQKTSQPLTTETNSFSNQLKSSLEKTGSAITVASRDLVSEQSQKQVDQLGQKLNLIQPEASNQLKEKMLMMVKDKVHTAEIRLDPSELGSMQIKISLQQDQMSVQFMVQQGNAKDLMEQQMPKLKELLQQQGIELSQGSVQQQNQSSSGQEGGRRTAGGSGLGSSLEIADDVMESAVIPAKNSDRVVDYYA